MANSCPILCNGHGNYENGRCSCFGNWHGKECEIPIDQCEEPRCNDNGICENGKCSCYIGFEGNNCEIETCSTEKCLNNGICVKGKCVCFSNYTGIKCEILIQRNNFLCSEHGEYDFRNKLCKCDQGWTGVDCSENENCLDPECKFCKNGRSGSNCLIQIQLSCDFRCKEHGICVNGNCKCSPGYRGRYCDINMCPNSCNSNGICEKVDGNSYQCVCNQGWIGIACDIPRELICNDGLDNDLDGLVDCEDSECCIFESCKLSLACQTSPEPKDRLLRKQPPSIYASFYEKVRFLIEDGSVQAFANSNSFSEKYVHF